jgi:predicted Ser/Thr protein kinase
MSNKQTAKERAENYMKLKAGYKQTPLQRIQRVINFYYKRGCNKESVNRIYYKILKDKFKNK